jgi:hypothetical protein
MATSMERRPPPVLRNTPDNHASRDGRAVAGDVLGQRWGKMQGWQVLSGPSGGGITGGVGLTLTGNVMDLDPATGTTIGGMSEPPPTGRGFMRRNAAGVASWVDVDIDGGRF